MMTIETDAVADCVPMKTSVKVEGHYRSFAGAAVAGCSAGPLNTLGTDRCEDRQRHGQSNRADIGIRRPDVACQKLTNENLRACSGAANAEPSEKPDAKATGNQCQFRPVRSQNPVQE